MTSFEIEGARGSGVDVVKKNKTATRLDTVEQKKEKQASSPAMPPSYGKLLVSPPGLPPLALTHARSNLLPLSLPPSLHITKTRVYCTPFPPSLCRRLAYPWPPREIAPSPAPYYPRPGYARF